jgi:thioredoxin reductase
MQPQFRRPGRAVVPFRNETQGQFEGNSAVCVAGEGHEAIELAMGLSGVAEVRYTDLT